MHPATIEARDFIAKWGPQRPVACAERARRRAGLIHLCRLLGVPEPDAPARYCFEKGLTRTGSEVASGALGINGFADVWLQGSLCVGIQGAWQEPGGRARVADDVRAAAGNPAAAGRLRPAAHRGADCTLGLLHSRLHELWALRLGISLEDPPRYTPTTCFETFPFPAGLTPADTAHQRTETLPDGAIIPAGLPPAVRPHAEAIARAARRLVELRDAWLNPPEWTERVPEVAPLGLAASPYSDRIVARPGHAADLARRTLTNLYNARPAWLAGAHAALDAAVAAAYGWHDSAPALSHDEILRRLLALNLQRSA